MDTRLKVALRPYIWRYSPLVSKTTVTAVETSTVVTAQASFACLMVCRLVGLPTVGMVASLLLDEQEVLVKKVATRIQDGLDRVDDWSRPSIWEVLADDD